MVADLIPDLLNRRKYLEKTLNARTENASSRLGTKNDREMTRCFEEKRKDTPRIKHKR